MRPAPQPNRVHNRRLILLLKALGPTVHNRRRNRGDSAGEASVFGPCSHDARGAAVGGACAQGVAVGRDSRDRGGLGGVDALHGAGDVAPNVAQDEGLRVRVVLTLVGSLVVGLLEGPVYRGGE